MPQPMHFKDGKQYSGYNINASDFVGVNGSIAGIGGLVPAPQIGDEDKFLKGDGTWAEGSGGTSGEEISYEDWLQLPEAERNSGDWYIPDYGGSIVPIGGFDNTPTQGSLKPVTSNGIFNVEGDLDDLDTTNKNNLVGAINEVNGRISEYSANVFSNGIKTISQIADELFALIDKSKLSGNTVLEEASDNETAMSMYKCIGFNSTIIMFSRPRGASSYMAMDEFILFANSSKRYEYTVNDSSFVRYDTSDTVMPTGYIYRIRY